MPALPLLSPSQQQVANALMADFGMGYFDADKVARQYRGDDPAPPLEEDQPLFDYATGLTDRGVPANELADWMTINGYAEHKFLHLNLGYTLAHTS